MFELDHIAISAGDLETGKRWIENVLGVPMQQGGKHARYATHNTLLGLGDIYLEVIAKDPNSQQERPTWFGLDDFTGPPRPSNWICRGPLDHSPHITGAAVSLSRGDLNWELTVPEDGHLPMDGGFPTLIRWGQETAHPAQTLIDQGCRLAKLTVFHPQSDELRTVVRIDDPRVAFEDADRPALMVEIDTPSGRKILK